jgi:flagella basal body P-ring formation protein FlgA
LGQYLDFRLAVLVAKAGIAQGAQVTGPQLESRTLTLAPGQEVLTSATLADGLQARSFFGPGMRLKLSRLAPPALVKRGTAVQLKLHSSGVELSAQGTALADAYAGQPLSVRRDSDGRIIRGILQRGANGPVVDVK